MAPPILHVIYAGRGDAMILECDDYKQNGGRNFILVDGGPRDYDAFGGRQAPYHRYLSSACQQIMGNGKNFAAIVFSHPDEDHYGGYLHSLQGGVFPTSNVFIPNASSNADSSNKPIDDICIKANMRKVAPSPQDEFPEYLFPPVKAIFPLGVVWYYGGTDRDEAHYVPPNPQMTKNQRSILMYTFTPKSAGEMGIFFTGDSHADIISPQIDRAIPLEERRFAIYKIQHHGALPDNMKQFSEPKYSDDVEASGFTYFLLKVQRGTAYLPFEPAVIETVKYAAGELTRILKLQNRSHYFSGLQYAIEGIQQHHLATLKPPAEKDDKIFIDFRLNAPSDLRKNKDLLKELDAAIDKPKGAHRQRWKKFREAHPTPEFKTYLHVCCVRKFYVSFWSDVYVVSANQEYHHPRPEVLVGLALAVKDQQRRARLYVTSGKSIDMEKLDRVAKVMGQGSVEYLFFGDHLRISYLSRGTYMSLSGESQGMENAPNIERDTKRVTQEIQFPKDDTQLKLRNEMHVWLEQADHDDLLMTETYQLRSFVNGAWRYLYLKADQTDQTGISWDIADEDNLQTVWIDKKGLKIITTRAFDITCRIAKFTTLSRRFRCTPAGLAYGFQLYFLEDTLSQEVLYHVPGGDIDFGRNPNNEPWAAVHLRPAPAQLFSETDSSGAIDTNTHVETLPELGSWTEATAFGSQHSVRQAFKIMNDPIKDKLKPNMIETLSRLYKDKNALMEAIGRLPESLLKIGLATFEVDLDASTATVDSRPLKEKVIGSAILRRLSTDPGASNVDTEMAGFDFQLKEIVVKVDHCCSPQVHLTVESEATLKGKDIDFKMAWKASKEETIISFSSSVASIKDLVTALGAKIDPEKILEGDVPLMGKSWNWNTAATVDDMGAGAMTEIGLSLRQPIDLVDTYHLDDIWVRTESSDWKNFLPTTGNFKNVTSEVFVRVLDPLHLETSRIATSVKISMPLPSNSERNIAAQFDAIPLARAGDYDYRFQITSVDYGVTVHDIVSAIGLDNVSETIQALPVLDHVSEAVEVQEAGFSIVRADSKWEFREWDFELRIAFFDLIPESLSLVDTVIRVEWYGDGDIQAKGEGTFRSEKLEKEAQVSLKLPTQAELGSIIFSSPDAINLEDVFKIFGLGSLPDIAFLNGNSAMELVYCDAKFEQVEKGKVSIRSSTIKFQRKELIVEDFKLQDVEFSLSWQRGEKRDEEDKPETIISFQVSALLPIKNIKSKVLVNYDGRKKILSASITPVRGFPMKVSDLLSFLIPGVDSVLHTRLGDLEIKIVNLSLDVSTGSPSSFTLELRDDAALELPSATETRAFTVGSVRVEYTKEMSKLNVFAAFVIQGIKTNISLMTSTGSSSEERSLKLGISLAKGQSELGLLALLAALGIDKVEIPRPEGCPEFTIGTANIEGKLLDKDKSGLKFAQLSVHIEVAGVLMSDWDMSMDYIHLDVNYNSDKPLSASVTGRLTVAKSAEMTIKYVDIKDALELDAELGPIKDNEVKVKSILEWLARDSIEDALPTFIAEAVIDLKSSKFGMSLSRHKGEGSSVISVCLSFTLGSVTVQLARTQTRPNGTKEGDKLPWKIILKLAVNTLPRPPPLPLIGQMEQPFSTQIYWTNSDILPEEVDKLNSAATFKNQQLLGLNRSVSGPAFGQGLSFMLLENGEAILATKPRKSKKKDGPSGKMIVILEEEENPEAPEMKKVNKRVNGVSITNIGLEYDAKRQRIKVKFTARMTVGPFDGELINFSMSINLPRGEKIDLSVWKNLDIDMGLDGLSLAMSGSNLNVAGTLHRIKVEEEENSVTGFEGGVSVKLKKYQFVGFGSYKNVKRQQEEFVSLMAYAMLDGPMVKTGLVELSGISGGFGFGSKLEIPSITDIHKFPLLVSPDVDPMIMFERLRGTGDTKYMTETNGANWVAAGVTGTACEFIDVKAVLTIPLDPSAGELAIVGIASAQFPRDAKPGKALAAIRINFQGSIDISRGFMLFEGRISDGSFILFDDCVLSGGFAVGAWFGPSPQAGDWCITIGGWHPKFQAPSHYPSAPPRMRLQWSYGDTKYLTLDGQAYAAVTPDAIMAGLAVQVKFEKWSCGANFDFRTDLILWLHPLHYDVYFHVSASLWYEVDAWIARKKLHISMGADLYISGPPFAGTVEFDVSVMVIRVKFGDHRIKDEVLRFDEFMSVVLRNENISHVFSLESGGIVPRQAPTEAQTPDSTWIVRGGSLAFSIASRMPTTRIEFTGARDHERKTGRTILARPMQLSAASAGLRADMDVSVTNSRGSLMHDFNFEVTYEQLPKSLWGPFNSNPNTMLYGASESTVTHATGLSIQAPAARWSSNNPRVIQFSKVARSEPVHASFNNDSTRDNGLDATPRANVENPGAEFENAREALMGSGELEEKLEAVNKRNARRSYIVGQWMGIRKLKAPASLRSDVPLRYAKDLAHFSHVAPRVSLE
nr:hypothetical protein FVER53263_12463 [Fusarium verticillioides]